MKPVWDEFVHHPFVMALGDGTLPLESFKGYIIQDYIYLVCNVYDSIECCADVVDSLFSSKRPRSLQVKIHHQHFSRKSLTTHQDTMLMIQSTEIVGHIIREMQLHINYCKTFGISEEEIQNTPEHQGMLPNRISQ